jgi:2-polyprenyl-3-methyl-5-hydroxy-6-metoxy-1,4-benzoquinol methylase
MIDKHYKMAYRTAFREILQNAPKGHFDECTIPSYAHSNALISWLFWKRIGTALTLAGDVHGKSVLDFGCGGGVTFKYLHEHQCEITGCENQFFEMAKEIAARLNIPVRMYGDISIIGRRQFDVIFALDVLEHVEDLGSLIDRFLGLSHPKTKLIISGPTESLVYRTGRHLIGYADQGRFHERSIFDVERVFNQKGLKNVTTKNLYFPFTLFRVSVWTK